MRDKLLLIDGHNLLFRMFFGIPVGMRGTDGQCIHGVVGFMGALLRTLTQYEPTHLMVVFDHEGGSFRKEMDQDYKGNRVDYSETAADENPFSQLAPIHSALDYLGWRHAEIPDVEADDVIAAYVRRYASESDAIILSTDSDLLQLVGNGICVVHPRGKEAFVYGPAEVEAKYGVAPHHIPDLKALTGDKTDNLIGVPGVGPKTASGLIQRFGGVAEIFENLDAVPAPMRDKLDTHRERVFHNVSMTRLDLEVALPFELSELALTPQCRLHTTMGLLRGAGVVAS